MVERAPKSTNVVRGPRLRREFRELQPVRIERSETFQNPGPDHAFLECPDGRPTDEEEREKKSSRADGEHDAAGIAEDRPKGGNRRRESDRRGEGQSGRARAASEGVIQPRESQKAV